MRVTFWLRTTHQPLALDEKGTLKWYAIKLGPGKFGIFDTFANEAGRNAHLSGDIAKALGARASELFAVPPQVGKVEVLANTPLNPDFQFDCASGSPGVTSNIFIDAGLRAMMTGRRPIPSG